MIVGQTQGSGTKVGLAGSESKSLAVKAPLSGLVPN